METTPHGSSIFGTVSKVLVIESPDHQKFANEWVYLCRIMSLHRMAESLLAQDSSAWNIDYIHSLHNSNCNLSMTSSQSSTVQQAASLMWQYSRQLYSCDSTAGSDTHATCNRCLGSEVNSQWTYSGSLMGCNSTIYAVLAPWYLKFTTITIIANTRWMHWGGEGGWTWARAYVAPQFQVLDCCRSHSTGL